MHNMTEILPHLKVPHEQSYCSVEVIIFVISGPLFVIILLRIYLIHKAA